MVSHPELCSDLPIRSDRESGCGNTHIPIRGGGGGGGGGFTEDPKEAISGNQIFRAREASYICYYASRGRDFSYFGLFPL